MQITAWKPPGDPTHRYRSALLFPLFRWADGQQFYENKPCVPRHNIRAILHLVHDRPISGRFSSTETLSGLEYLHFRHKLCDVCSHSHVCLKFQQQKNSLLNHMLFLSLLSSRIGSGGQSGWISLPIYPLHPLDTMLSPHSPIDFLAECIFCIQNKLFS